jgi:hypothetical protein
VILEDHVRGVHRSDPLHVVGVPGVVVGGDRLVQLVGRAAAGLRSCSCR